MTERDFCYWLQGLFELTEVKSLTESQVKMIRDHLKTVFIKVTPDHGSAVFAPSLLDCLSSTAKVC